MEMNTESFIYRTDTEVVALVLFVLMLLCIYGGRKIGLRRLQSHIDSEAGATGRILSAMFGLLAFILAFTFSMSASRYDTRRKNIVDEANAIGTAILRADLYTDEYRSPFRNDFQQYLEARIRYYEAGRNKEDMNKALSAANDNGSKLWSRAAQLSQNPDYFVASQQMIPALNEMLDLSTTRLIGEMARVPDSVVIMLFMLSLACAFYVGYSSAGKAALDWSVAIGFCLLTSIVIYITLDLDRPRRGFIQLSTSEQAMVELRKLFNE